MEKLRAVIRGIQDFPKPGILFYDITPLLQDATLFHSAIDSLCAPYLDEEIDLILGIDARGFLLAPAVAYKLGKGLAIVRKKGKLPHDTHSAAYDLEYGDASLEMHVDAVKPGQRVLVVDDVLATGGTAEAAGKLVRAAGGEVAGYAFLLELEALKGRERLGQAMRHSILLYD